jgi:hypothetical protein
VIGDDVNLLDESPGGRRVIQRFELLDRRHTM